MSIHYRGQDFYIMLVLCQRGYNWGFLFPHVDNYFDIKAYNSGFKGY